MGPDSVFGVAAHGAGEVEDHVGVRRLGRDPPSAPREMPGEGLGVVPVHLAAEGEDVEAEGRVGVRHVVRHVEELSSYAGKRA